MKELKNTVKDLENEIKKQMQLNSFFCGVMAGVVFGYFLGFLFALDSQIEERNAVWDQIEPLALSQESEIKLQEEALRNISADSISQDAVYIASQDAALKTALHTISMDITKKFDKFFNAMKILSRDIERKREQRSF